MTHPVTTPTPDARLLWRALEVHDTHQALADAISYRRETIGRWLALARAGQLRLTPRARRDLARAIPSPSPEEYRSCPNSPACPSPSRSRSRSSPARSASRSSSTR